MDIEDNKPKEKHKFQQGNNHGKGRPKGSVNRQKLPTKEDILKDIHDLYLYAIGNKHWGVALRALNDKAKLIGLYRTRKLPNITRLTDMNEEELRDFVEILKEHDPECRELEDSE